MPDARGAGAGLDLHLDLTARAQGVGRALENALREAVRSGRLAPGALLPGSRGLAADLGLSRGTVVQAYAQLAAEGWLAGSPGSGTRVAGPLSDASPAGARSTTARPPEEGRTWLADLRPGRPDLGSFPRSAWLASVRRAVSAADPGDLDYGDPAGVPALRAVIAGYVSRTRGASASADSVVVTAGFAQGLALLARTFHRLGSRHAAVEDPCLERHRDLLRAGGLRPVPLPVGADGAEPDGLDGRIGAALLTPAHQHPSGVVLAPRRRTAFVAWARHHDAYLVEDDYDGEFRYDRQPIGALQALAPDRVVLGGTAGKALAPGMRLGWLVVPPALRGPLLESVADTAAAVPAIDQLALADLIDRGDYDRHIRRLRLVYRRRRAELERRLAEVTPASLAGVPAGLHALLPVGSPDVERHLITTGEYAGLRLQGLHTSGYWHTPEGRPAALVIGYGTPAAHAWHRALDLLAEVLAAS